MSDIVPHKLKVTELRDELKKRGLDTKGKKEQLVKRLLNALGMTDEAGADDSMATVDESDASHVCDTSAVSAAADEPPGGGDEPVNGRVATEATAGNDAGTAIDDSARPNVAEPSSVDESSVPPVAPEVAVAGPASEVPSGAAESCTVDGDASSTARADSLSEQTAGCALYTLPGSESGTSITSSQQSAADDSAPAADSASIASNQQPSAEDSAPAADSAAVIASNQPPADDSAPAADSTAVATNQQSIADDSAAAAADAGQSSSAVVSGEADAASVAAAQNDESPMPLEDRQGELPGAISTGAEVITADPTVLQADHEIDVKMEQDIDAPPTTTSVSLSENCVAAASTAAADGSGDAAAETKDLGEKKTVISKVESRRSPSREQISRSPRRRSRSPVEKSSLRAAQPLPIVEDDSWLSSEDVQIDRYNSDLNLVIKDAYTTVPLCQAGFAYMWAGAKATHGVTSGKVAFEIKIVDEPKVDLPADDKFHNVARVGWSFDSGSTMLGEDKTSWGYGGTGKISHANAFKDYGKPFAKGDVITAYLDLESASAVMAFSKNGQDLGTAYEIPKSELKGAALFPTILCKNTEVTMNFGLKEAAYPLREGFGFIGHVPREQLVRAALPPPKKSDAEVLMMIGLPGAGKSYWAAKHCEAHPEKRFNVLGTNAIIDKMKVSGLYRKFNYAGRWDVLFDKSNKCLSKLIELACSKRRNYIIDQTNVYASAQKRKMKPFEGFRRKAVVVVPSEDEFRVRVVKRTKDEGKQVPEEAVTEMKANFSVPHVGEVFDEVLYPELPEAEVKKLVAQYVKEGQTKFPPGSRRFNDRRQGSSQDNNSNRDSGRERGFSGPRDNYRNDRPGYGGNYRSGGGFNDGNSGFGNQRSERGYYPTQNPSFSSGDRGYGGVQNSNFGAGGSHVGQQQRPWDAPPRAAGVAGGPIAGPLASGGGGAAAGGSGGWGAAGAWAGSQAQHPYGSGGAAGAYGPSGAGGYRSPQVPAAASPYGSRHDSYAGRSGAGYGGQSAGPAPAAASAAVGYGSAASVGYGGATSSGYGGATSGGYGGAAPGGYGGATSGGYGGATSGGYGGATSGGYGGATSGGYGGATSGGYGGASSGAYGGATSGGYGGAPSSGGYGSAAPSASYGGVPPSGGYGSVPSGSYGSTPASATYGANPPGGYSRSQPSGGGSSSYYGSAQPGAPAAASYGAAQVAGGQAQSFASHSAGGYSSGQPAHPSSYSSQTSAAGNQSRAYGSGTYGSGQSGYGSWPAPQPQQPVPARPPAAAAAVAAPAVAPQQQWGQQQHGSGSAWPQPSPSGYGSYGQRR